MIHEVQSFWGDPNLLETFFINVTKDLWVEHVTGINDPIVSDHYFREKVRTNI
jgi:hypothetical protein